MRAGKIALISAAAILVFLVAGAVSMLDKIEYFYFDIAGSEVDTADWQKPDLLIYVGDKVPLKSTVSWGGKEYDFLNVNDCCIPFLEIRSPVPLSNILVTTGKTTSELNDQAGLRCVRIFAQEENSYQLSWIYWPEHTRMATCIRVGDKVSIEIIPEDGSQPLVVDAILNRSGHYWL